MIHRLRVKFVCINMTIVAVMLCAIFATVFLMTRRNLAMESVAFLEKVAEKPMASWGVGEDAELRLPFLVVDMDETGVVKAVGAGRQMYEDADFLETLVRLSDADGRRMGILPEYQLRYYRMSAGNVQRMVFVNISSETAAMQNTIRSGLIIAVLSLLVFFVISVLLARWAVRPVEAAWEGQRRFVADASHELKTPLTVILANAEMIRTSGYDQALMPKRMENISEESKRMKDLVEHLLTLARADSGIPRQQMEPVDSSGAVSRALLPFEPVLFENGHPLTSHIEENIRVRGSRQHLMQVLEILLDNANKYAAPGGKVEVRLEREEKFCLLRVYNDGEPLETEQCKKVFQRFYRGNAARSADGSYGLGLAIAAGIVKDHRGKIWVEPEQGGNTFAVRLPLLREKSGGHGRRCVPGKS